MTDTEASPLSDDERAELEALRAEKTRREEEERTRQERAELEALRAERALIRGTSMNTAPTMPMRHAHTCATSAPTAHSAPNEYEQAGNRQPDAADCKRAVRDSRLQRMALNVAFFGHYRSPASLSICLMISPVSTSMTSCAFSS